MTNKREIFEQEATHKVLSHWNETAPGDRIAHLVKDTSKAFLRSLQDHLAPFGIQLGQWIYLRILWKKEGLTKRELSIEAGVMEPTAFVALKGMQEARLIYFEKKNDNKKNIYVYLTEKGRDLEKRLIPEAVKVNEIATQGISENDMKITRKVLLSMLLNLST